MIFPHPFLRPSRVALAVIAVTVLLVLAAFYGEGQRHSHPMGVVASAPVELGGTVTLNLSLQSNVPVPLPVRAALVPMAVGAHSDAVYFVQDPALTAAFGNPAEIELLLGRVQSELAELGSPTHVQVVDGSGLARVVANDSNASSAIVLDLEYGALPATVLSNSTNLLTPWLDAGGTLVWAGGPLGYYNGTSVPTPNGTVTGGLGWAAQERLLGFNLADPSPTSVDQRPVPGPVTGNASTSLGIGLGLQYNGTVFGANVSTLALHHGLSLGWETPLGEGPIRTSLAYLPVGNGSLYYFGGAIVAPPGVYVPEAGERLAQDVAELIAFPFVPYSGPVEVDNVTLAVYGSGALSLTLRNASGPLGLLVSADLSGSVVYEYLEQIPLGGPHAPTPKIRLG